MHSHEADVFVDITGFPVDMSKLQLSDIIYKTDNRCIGVPYAMIQNEGKLTPCQINLENEALGYVKICKTGEKIPLADVYDKETDTFDFLTEFKPGTLVQIYDLQNCPAEHMVNGLHADDGYYVLCLDIDEVGDYMEELDEDEPDGSDFDLLLVPAKYYYNYCKIHAQALLELTDLYGDTTISDSQE
jgi:hypothetical protein